MKNDVVLVDGKEFLSFKDANHHYELTLYKLHTTDELMFVTFHNNETEYTKQDDYYKINFIPLGLKMETHNWNTWKKSMQWFVENKLFTDNGELNEEKVKLFIDKYNERISDK